MRVLAVLLCGLAFALASQEEWEAWKEEYGREYGDDSEESHRHSVFENNLAFINSHNADYDNGLVTFTLGMNQFGDMTTEEIQSYMLGFLQDDSSATVNRPVFTADKHDKLPKEIDWRTKAPGAVTPVKDQKVCGSCWAFSATGSMEGQHFLKTNKTVSLSEQNLVDCSAKEGNHGCHGGNMDAAFNYVKINNGIDTEESYPYTAMDGTTCKFSPDKVGSTVTGHVDITHGDEKALEKAVATVGPISVAIDAHLPTFHFYKSGVYHDAKCSSHLLDHGVLAVGYGVDKKITTWGDGKGMAYWLVKNSWNAKWGDEGYIKMARNADNACGIATDASYPLM